MKTFVINVIILAILYILLHDFWKKRSHRNRSTEYNLVEGGRTIDDIMNGRTFHEILEELDSKE